MLRTFGALALSIFLIATLAHAQDADDRTAGQRTLMDDPKDQDQLLRQIWESTSKTPYAAALEHARKAQAESAKAVQASSLVTLPTGWKILPAGAQVNVGTLPFDAVAFNGSVVVVDSGSSTGPQDFKVVDPTAGQVTRTVSIQNVFPGAAIGPGGDLYISGGFSKQAYRYNAHYSLAATYTLSGFTHGLAGLDSRYLIATYTEAPLLGGLASVAHAVKIDTTTGNIAVNTTLGSNEPYSVSVMRGKVYVTLPAANQVIVLDNNLNPLKTLNVGRSPLSTCQDGSNLYVIDANSDDVAVVNT
ncbi:MAG: hypothetical protein JOZ22_13980, partial [Acidobacteriia bacterium]|nr:hypothetical protein [Terriglobia bacterium]